MLLHSVFRRSARAGLLLFTMCAVASPVLAQGTTVSGRLTHATSQEPIAGATVLIEGTRLEAKSGADGSYSIANVPVGAHHILVVAPGFMPTRAELKIDGTPLIVDVAVDPELHYREVVSVSPDARSQFESYQPTTLLAGQDLYKQLQGTLGATLATQPGVAERSFGPGPSRPVIRGLDGDRVLILEDGQRVGDLSSQSGDHGVSANPALSSRIEVVRGPATLLYGANAIGGLVNVISNIIPTTPFNGASGGVTLDLGSAVRGGGGAADVLVGNRRWALHASVSGRSTGDVRTPEGPVANTQSRGGTGSAALSWTGARGYAGASYGYDDTKYGVPFIEDGQIQLTPRRHSFGVRAGSEGLGGPIESFRVTVGHRQYRHEELEGEEVGTRFENDTTDVNLLAGHRRIGRLTGTIGGSFFDRRFNAVGSEALSPAVDERATALFLYEELTWPHVTVQFGGRINRASFRPAGGLTPRDFTDGSGSLGVLLRPAAANDKVTLALNIAHASRNPALEELYFFGAHPGNFAFEIGNAQLDSERALGFDAALRWRHRRINGEVTFFRNSIKDYIFRNPISETEFEARFGHDDHGEEQEDEGHGHGEFPFIEFVAADSVLHGIEAHADVQISQRYFAEIGFDLVRGELQGSGDALPRIPPTRFRAGLRYQANAFQAGGEWINSRRQARIFGEETPTDGYNLFKLYAAYSFGRGRTVNTITARLDNVADELYRNHLSLIKDVVPEMGRNLKLLYSVRF